MRTDVVSFERRSVSRTSIIDGAALLFFRGQPGARGCKIVDISHRGVRVRVRDLRMLPVTFSLTFDNFTTVQPCHLVWRGDEFIGAAFQRWIAGTQCRI